MRRLLLLLAALGLAACDTDDPEPLLFAGVEVEARGDAALAVEGGRLVVSGLDGTRSGGFTLPGRPDRVDVEIDPLAVPPGGRFGAFVEDDDGVEVASLFTEAGTDGRLDFRYTFADALVVPAVRIRYLLGGRVVFDGTLDLPQGRAARATYSGGEGDGEPGSTHVIRENGRYIVVSDSNSEPARKSGGCPYYLITPPPPFDQEFGSICTDWVEIEPLVSLPMPRGRVSVTARGVGQFAVRELAVDREASAE